MTAQSRLVVAAAFATALAASALGAVFDSFDWLPFAWGAVWTVAGTSLLARRLGAPSALVPLLSAAGLALFVTIVFGRGTAWGGLMPTPDTVDSLREQVRSGFTDIRELTAPVPGRRGLLLLVAGGIGLVAVLVDAIAVTLRRPALAGLPLLSLFAVPTAVAREGVGWFPFFLGGAGFLGLLLAEGQERVNRWGRPLSAQHAPGDTPSSSDRLQAAPYAAVGRRIGAAALGVAVIVPALLPGLSAGGLSKLATGTGLGTGGTGRSATITNPLARLSGELNATEERELLQVYSDDKPRYLRLTALDSYSGDKGWSQKRLSAKRSERTRNGLPAPAGLTAKVSSAVRTARISATDLRSPYLPAFYPPARVRADGDWRYDAGTSTVFSSRTTTRGLDYGLTYLDVQPTPEQLLAALPVSAEEAVSINREALNVAPEVRDLVDRLTRGKTTQYEKVLAIRDYFSLDNGFTYDTTTEQGTTGDKLADFLLQGKRGYCEQYAAAMAVMVKQAGYQARVAVGFTSGTRVGDHWSVTTKNAHAWPEVYFSGIGWVYFEPTPRGEAVAGGGATPPNYQVSPDALNEIRNEATGGSTVPGEVAPAPTAAGNSRLDRLFSVDRGATDTATEAGKSSAGVASRWPYYLGGLLIVLALLAPAVSRVLLRRGRLRRAGRADDPRQAAHAAWDEVLDDARDIGLPWDPAESPRGTAGRLVRQARLDATAAGALQTVARAEEQARYARSVRVDDDLPSAVLGVRTGLRASAGRRARTRARVLPSSVLRSASSGGGTAVADLLDRVDGGLARLRRRRARSGGGGSARP